MKQATRLTLGPVPMDYYFRWSDPSEGSHFPNSVDVGVDLGRVISESRSLRHVDAHLRSGTIVPLLLHWSDGTDLDEVDRRVADGSMTERDFEGAIVGQDLTAQCFNCGKAFLVIRYDTVPVLDDSTSGVSQERYRRHKFIEHCPGCGNRWLPSVLEVIAEVQPRSYH